MTALFLALEIPNVSDDMDVDELADEVAEAVSVAVGAQVMVHGIPSPQWLTPATLATLRSNAHQAPSETSHPLAIDLLDVIEGVPAEVRLDLAHAVLCAPCRQGLVNLIQTSPDFPDLFARRSERDRSREVPQ